MHKCTSESFWKTVQNWLLKFKIHIFYDPVILFLCIYATEIYTYAYKETSTRMFFIALKTIQCLTVIKWINYDIVTYQNIINMAVNMSKLQLC